MEVKPARAGSPVTRAVKFKARKIAAALKGNKSRFFSKNEKLGGWPLKVNVYRKKRKVNGGNLPWQFGRLRWETDKGYRKAAGDWRESSLKSGWRWKYVRTRQNK